MMVPKFGITQFFKFAHGSTLLLGGLVFLSACLFQGEGPSRQQSKGLNGYFLNVQGQPLQGVKVKAIPTKEFRLAKVTASHVNEHVDSVFTDGLGRYSFEDLPSGDYNLVGEYGMGELAILIPDIQYRESSGLFELGGDTLYAPGSIRGRLLRSGKGKEGVVIYVPGTSYLAVSDSSGDFAIQGIPRGKYNVNYLVPSLLAKNDTGVVVYSGRVTSLTNKVLTHDVALPPPTPNPPQLILDTMKGIVYIKWDPTDVEDLLGHLIYRDTGSGLATSLVTSRIVSDTFYVDTLNVMTWSHSDTVPLNYRLRSVDSFSQSARIHAPKKRFKPTEITLELRGKTQIGQAPAGDTVNAVVGFQNYYQGPLEIQWRNDSEPSWMQVDSVHGHQGILKRPFQFSEPGRFGIWIAAIDSMKDTAKTHAFIDVLDGRPTAIAGEDQEVSLGDFFTLSGTGRSDFGNIIKREWLVGSMGPAIQTESGVIEYQAPMQPAQLDCIYRVFDDQGRSHEDTVIVHVVADPPSARIRAPVEVFQGDTIRLKADSLIDRFGQIVRMEWSLGSSSPFILATQAETALVTSTTDSQAICKLRVTDDDGQTFVAQVTIPVVPRNRWLQVVSDAPFPQFVGLYAWVYNERLWVSESNPLHVSALGSQPVVLWSTGDLLEWKNENPGWDGIESTGQAPLPIRAEGGKIWGIKAGLDGKPRTYVSDDGQNWDSISTNDEFYRQAFSAVQPFRSELVFMGGVDNPRISDEIWMTRNGIEASRRPEKAAYGRRTYMRVAEMNNRLWIYGGLFNDQVSNDVWSTDDGTTWTRMTESALDHPRHLAGMAAYRNELWIVGETELIQNKSEVWRSSDGMNWSVDPIPAPFLKGASSSMALVSFRGRLCLIITRPDRQRVMRSEIWVAP
jgi:hypothetical protein